MIWNEETLPPAKFWAGGWSHAVWPNSREDEVVGVALETLDNLNITGFEAELLERVLRRTYQSALSAAQSAADKGE